MKRMPIVSVFLCIVLSFSFSVPAVFAQSSVPSEALTPGQRQVPQPEGSLPSGLTDSEIQAAIDGYVDRHRSTTAAVSVGVVRGQQTLFSQAYGYADIGAELPNDADTVFEWGSITKLLVWVSVMQLAEQGRLDLDSDITIYLPEGFFTKLTYDTQLTMRHLMNHNAGWQEVMLGLTIGTDDIEYPLGEALQRSEPPQIYEPGTVTAYSNWGVALAGYIVERVSGIPFYEYVHQNIFDVLGMRQTALRPRLQDNEWVKAQREKIKGYSGVRPMANDKMPVLLYPAGRTTGTFADFMLFVKAFLPESGEASPLYQNSATLTEMLQPTLYYGDSGLPRNCHGMWVEYYGVPVQGHAGGTVAFSANLLLHPQSGTGFVVMTNQASETIYNQEMVSLVFGKLVSPVAVGEAENSAGAAGWYLNGRTIRQGPLSIYKITGIMPFFQDGETGIKVPFFARFSQSTPNIYLVDDSITLPVSGLVYRDDSAANRSKLSLSVMDYLKISTVEGVSMVGLILLAALAFVYSIVVLAAGGIRTIQRKIYKKDNKAAFRIPHRLMCLAVVLEFVNMGMMIVLILNSLLMSVPEATVNFHVRLHIAFLVCTVVYLAAYFLRRKKLPAREGAKALYTITAFTAVILSANVLYWQMFVML